MKINLDALLVSLLAGGLLALLGACTTVEQAPDVSFDGLHRVVDSELGLVYATPGLDLDGYDKVGILEVEVAFKKNWRRQQLGITSSDMEKIKRNVAATFRSVFVEELESAGYEIVGQRGEDVLVVRPRILDLVVTAPDTRAGSDVTHTTSTGEATVLIELYDSVTGDILARAVDRRRLRGSRFDANAVTNSADAKRIFKIWAVALREGLDSVRGDVDVAAGVPE